MNARVRVRVDGREPAAREAGGGRGGRGRGRGELDPLDARDARPSSPAASPPLERALNDGGQPLDPTTRSAMEAALGHRFDEVRVHTGPRAARAAAELDAAALTFGQDIVFGAGRYQPETAAGRRLLAHELVHVAQHGRAGATPFPLLSVSPAPLRATDSELETEAETAAGLLAAGGRVPHGLVTVDAPQARHRVALAPANAVPAAPVEVPDSPEAMRELADEVTRLFAFDPEDLFGRVRRRLAQLAPGTRRALLTQLEGRLPEAAHARLAELLAEFAPAESDAAQPEEAAVDARERIAATEPTTTREGAQAAEEHADAEATGQTDATEAAVGADALGARLDKSAGPQPDLEAVVDPATAQEPDATVEPPQLEKGPASDDELQEAPGTAGELGSSVQSTGPGTAAPIPPPAAGPADVEADPQPADELEAETLDTLEVAETGDVGEPPELTQQGAQEGQPAGETQAHPGFEDEAAPAETAPEAEAETDDAAASIEDEASEPTGQPPAPEAEAGPPDVGAPEPESEDEVAVEEPPAAELDAESAESGAGTATEQQPDGVPDIESETVSETDAGASEELTLDEPAATEVDAGGGDLDSPAGGESGGGADVGGVPIPEPAELEAPDVSGMEPEQAMASVAVLPPAQLQAGLAGVSAASSRSVGDQRTALVANPPSLERPSGAPSAQERAAEELAVPAVPAAPARVGRAAQAPNPPPVRTPEMPPQGASPTERVPEPDVPGGPKGELSEDGARVLQASVRSLPTHDPALEERAGPPPPLVLEGSASPQQARAQREQLQQATQQAHTEGQHDVVAPAGEAALYPEVPPETLRAQFSTASAGAPAAGAVPAPAAAPTPGAVGAATAGGTAGAGAAQGGGDGAVSIVAQQERGAELRAATAAAQTEMSTQRRTQQTHAVETQAQSQQDVAELVRGSAAEQTAQRRGARTDVYERRREWSQQQRDVVVTSRGEADVESRQGAEKITQHQREGERAAAKHVESGNREAAAAKRQGEQRAARERERGERESSSSGVFGWLARKARAFFNRIKQAIQKAFEWARAAVRRAIQAAQRLAAAAIDLARQAIVAAIRKVGDALIAIGDRLLARFPALRDRFRQAIRDRVDRAVARVNQLADQLKADVQRALDALGSALDAALGVLERGLLAAVDAVGRAIQGAIQFARSVVQALAAFAALVRDVAAGPIQWLRNLGSSVVDGIRNHLWKAFKRAVKRWFNEKLEEVLGLGRTTWELLKKGGVSLARVGTMVWEGIKAAIPPTLIQILVEKLVAMIVPAVGAIMVIIEGLRAAWGTVQRILEAFQRFFTFLKAVKTGRAGPQFAAAVAAAAVAVIDFVANWLLTRLRKPAGVLAKKIREIAKKIGAKLGRAIKKIGKKVFKGHRKPIRPRKKPAGKTKPDKRAKAERRVKAATEFLGRQLGRGMPYPALRVQMAYARVRYRVRLRLRDRTDTPTLVVEVNPKRSIPLARTYEGTIKIEKYRKRATEFLAWIARFVDVHHILPKEKRLARWWTALGIDYNRPSMTLALPPFLHWRVHMGLRKLRLRQSDSEQVKAKKLMEAGWNAMWDVWVVERMRAAGVSAPRHLEGDTPGKKKLRAKLLRDIHRQINKMLETWSATTGENLRKLRITEKRSERDKERFRRQIMDFVVKLEQREKNPLDVKALVEMWRTGWKQRGIRRARDLSKKQARALARYRKSRG